jgi:hypothetical protein
MTTALHKRYENLFALEMTFNGENFYGMKEYNKDFNVHWSEAATDSDATWIQKIAYMQNELVKRKTNVKN